MNALGRGLASLIPRRNKENAEEVLEQIDSMEAIEEEKAEGRPVTVTADEEQEVAALDEESETHPEEESEFGENTAEKEFEDLGDTDNAPLPVKPKVTPLTIDPDTGTLQDAKEQQTGVTPKREAEPERPRQPVVAAAVRKKQKVVLTSLARGKAAKKGASNTVAMIPSDETIDAAIWDRHEDRVEQVAIGDIDVNPLQPRRNFAPEEMADLVQSIDQHGILQPLVVLRTTGGKYELVAGERRLRAAKALKWDKVPCVVRTDVKTDQGRLEMALVENIQRENLNPVEEATGYKRLNEEYGLSHEEIGARVGRSRVGITNVIRILQLPAEIQRGLAEGKISPGHARAILMIPDEEKQIRFYHHLLEENLTVRKAETRARRIQRQMKLNDPLRQKRRGRPQLALKYDGLLEEKYGYNARIKFDEFKNRFEVIFQAFNEKEAEELVHRLLQEGQSAEYPDDEQPDEEL
ncbi:MAG: ParB/RepB/Spo0J family partition protein [Candidatus Andersenbacteria bacterium]